MQPPIWLYRFGLRACSQLGQSGEALVLRLCSFCSAHLNCPVQLDLSRWSGTDSPLRSDVQRQTASLWSKGTSCSFWIVLPRKNPSGEDLGFRDDMVVLSGLFRSMMDDRFPGQAGEDDPKRWQQIAVSSRKLLRETKDVWLAVYLTAAELNASGFVGLESGPQINSRSARSVLGIRSSPAGPRGRLPDPGASARSPSSRRFLFCGSYAPPSWSEVAREMRSRCENCCSPPARCR